MILGREGILERENEQRETMEESEKEKNRGTFQKN